MIEQGILKDTGDISERGAIDEDLPSKKRIAGIALLPLFLFFVSLFLGRYFIDPVTVLKILGLKIFGLPFEPTWADTVEAVVIRIRLPRALMAVAVGAGLSISGAGFQGMFHNPLVSPYLLGVSSGAGFGAAVAIMMNASNLMLQTFAFFGGLIAVTLTYFLSRVYRTTPMLMLVLSGVVVSAFFQALISLLKYSADTDDKLPAIVFWLMGSLGHVRLSDLAWTLPAIAAGVTGLILVRWRINILSMGDREARAMGINTEMLKGFIILCSTIISAADTRLAQHIMTSLGISHLANKRYTEISGGERQLVLIARTLCQEPDVILLDEPTSHLDLKNQAIVLRTVKRLSEEGLTIIITTHFPNHAWLFTGKTVLMNEGKFIALGPASEVMTEENLSMVYGIRVRVISAGDGGDKIRFCSPVY